MTGPPEQKGKNERNFPILADINPLFTLPHSLKVTVVSVMFKMWIVATADFKEFLEIKVANLQENKLGYSSTF